MKPAQKFSWRHRPCTGTFGSHTTNPDSNLCGCHDRLTRTGQGICFSEQPSKPNPSSPNVLPTVLTQSAPFAFHRPSSFSQADQLFLARPQDQLPILILPEAGVTPGCLLSHVCLCFPSFCPSSLLIFPPLTMFLRGSQQEFFSFRLHKLGTVQCGI